MGRRVDPGREVVEERGRGARRLRRRRRRPRAHSRPRSRPAAGRPPPGAPGPTRASSSCGLSLSGASPPTRTLPVSGVRSPTSVPEQGRLARAVAAHDGDDLAGRGPRGPRRAAPPSSPCRTVRSVQLRTYGRRCALRRSAARLAAGRDQLEARSERPGACRRASRTESGSGVQPASRPSSTTGGATGEVCQHVAGSPRARSPTVRRCSRTTRSAYCTTRSRRCSASSTVMPRSCTSRCRAARTSSAAPGSRADVGSSSTSTRGWAVSTEPMATRWRWPPDSVRSGRCRRSARPSRSRVSSTRLRMTSGASPRDSMP